MAFKSKMRLLIAASTVAGMLAVLVLAGCSSAAPASKPPVAPPPASTTPAEPPPGPVQSNSGGSVTIEARLLGHQNDSLVFEISMDTHSVNLDAYDLRKLTVLRDDKGGEFIPADWSTAPGGHHKSGKLVFAHPDQSAKTFELLIRDVAGVNERVLRWRA